MFVHVISTGSIKGQRSLRAQKAEQSVNILLGGCALSPPHTTYLFVCACVCLFVSVWGRLVPRRLEHLSRGDPAHSWTPPPPPPLAVPPNFLLWLGLWGVGGLARRLLSFLSFQSLVWWDILIKSHITSEKKCWPCSTKPSHFQPFKS